nr:FecR family protein [Pedobacter sp. ASV19]
MDNLRLTYLFNACYHKTATEDEKNELLSFIAQPEYDEHLKSLLTTAWTKVEGHTQIISDLQAEKMLSGILQPPSTHQEHSLHLKHRSLYRKLIPAAAAVLVAGSSLYFTLRIRPSDSGPNLTENQVAHHQGQKDSNKAILTLSDGSEITLDEQKKGDLFKQGLAAIVKTDSTTLAYKVTQGQAKNTIYYNTLSTPKGSQYKLILPDGTKVWLNSASSVRYPTQFQGKERNINLNGEAYFEVAKDAKRPFKVTANHTEVQVLGTHFNIMAYADESSVNTTLLEGSVKVKTGKTEKMLVPGQESRTSSGHIHVIKADVEDVMAWKNGWISLNGDDVQKVMRKISRSYGVEVRYEGKIPEGHFSGSVRQDNDISKILNILRAGGIQFKNSGKNIIVLP